MNVYFIADPRFAPFLYRQLTHELQSLGITVLRTDDISPGTNWQATILSAIKRADVVVAHLRGGLTTSNVMLELGYSIGAGKHVILLAEDSSGIPLDLASVPVIVAREMGPWLVEDIVTAIQEFARKGDRRDRDYATARDHLMAALNDPDVLEQISPVAFESLVGNLLHTLALDAEMLPERSDSGFDILLRFENRITAAVVVKKYASQGRLGIADVQRLVGACVVAEIQHAFMITTGGFTSSAREFAARSPVGVHLLTLGELLQETKSSITARCT
ncbi:MAG: restriction endonuclease [Planctomycetes bacterium]|nr:restriction endonuclease [Planctomycetota bacterium]